MQPLAHLSAHLLTDCLAEANVTGAIVYSANVPLRENLNRRHFERVLDNAEDAFIIADEHGKVLFMNKCAHQTYGFRERDLGSPGSFNLQEYVLQNFHVLTADGEEFAEGQDPISELLRGEPFASKQLRVKHVDHDEERMLVVSGQRLDGEPPITVVTIRDETEQWKAHERFRVTFELDPAPSVVAKLSNAEIVMADTGMSELTGIPRTELKGQSLADLELLADNEELWATTEALKSDNRIFKRKTTLRRADDTELDVLVSARALELDGAPCGIFTFVDITDLEGARREQQRTQRSLTHARSRLAQRREHERVELARDLHDGALQNLLAMHTQMAHQKTRLRDDTAEDAARTLNDLQTRVLDTVKELRTAIRGLRPTAIRELGLWQALHEVVPDEANGPEIVIPDQEPPSLPERTTLTVFRVAQEAIRNAVKHANAETVRVALDIEGDTVSLEVRDDGQGFEPPDNLATLEQQDSFGLISMEEQAHAQGGSLIIQSAPGAGTTVRLVVPREPLHDYPT